MALSSSNAVKQLSDKNSQGTVLGQSATDKIAFYGASASARLAVGASLSTAVSSTGAFGFGDANTASSVVAAIAHLQTLGLLG